VPIMTSDLRPLTAREKNILDCLLNTYYSTLINDLVHRHFITYEDTAMALASAELLVRRLKTGLVPPYTAEDIRGVISVADRPAFSA
jgi:hypothetical protein